MVEIDLFLYAGRKSLGFSVSIEMDLVLKVGEIDLISVWGIGIDLISVQRSETAWFLCVAVENDLFLAYGLKYLGFCVGASKSSYIRVGIEIDLISVMGSKLIWFFFGGSNLT